MNVSLPPEIRDLLAAVLAAIDIPYPAMIGDQPAQREVLAERAMHAAITVRRVLDADGTRFPVDPAWETAYLREKLAEHPPAGYKTGPWPGTAVDRAQPPEGGGR